MVAESVSEQRGLHKLNPRGRSHVINRTKTSTTHGSKLCLSAACLGYKTVFIIFT